MQNAEVSAILRSQGQRSTPTEKIFKNLIAKGADAYSVKFTGKLIRKVSAELIRCY